MRGHQGHTLRLLTLTLLSVLILGLGTSEALAVIEKPMEGPTRFDTAVEMSMEGWDPGPGTDAVIITTGMNWPDALGGAVFSGGQMARGPILLVEQDSIPDAVWTEINRLDPTRAIILGGDSAISPAVETQLVSKLGAANVVRLAGADRYETSNKIAEYAITMDNDDAGSNYDGVAFVATGMNFPDALAAGPVSAFREWPIFLADPNAGEDGTVPAAFMKAQGVTDVYILGGLNAVTQTQEDMLEAEFPGKVNRLSGQDRYATGARIAQFGDDSNLQWGSPCITTGENFPDALAGGPFAARWMSVILITPGDELHSAPKAKLEANKADIQSVFYLGGTQALSQDVRDEVYNLIP